MNDHDDEPTLPHDTGAERIVLGAMLLDPERIDELAAIADPQAFYAPAHVEIAEALVAMHADGRPTDPVAVMGEFMRRGRLDRIGGGPYLHRLIESVPAAAMAGSYATTVRGHANMRRIAETGTRLLNMGLDPTTDPDDIPDMLHAAIKDLGDALTDIPSFVAPAVGPLLAPTLDAVEHPETVACVPTGIRDLDRCLAGGVAPGQITLIAARPSVGKSVFGLNVARSAAMDNGIPTLLVSSEMSTDQVMRRLISAEAKVELHRLRVGECTEDDWARIARVSDKILNAPLYIDENPKMSLGQLRQAIRTMTRTTGLGLVIIDYLQLMNAPKAENRQMAVTELSRGLKVLAKESGLPIIALSQLNRESTKRTDKKPTSSDLRESGSLEQDADVIILMHREDMYEPESPRAGECDLIVDKNRDGTRPTITVAFQGHYARLADMARSDVWTPHAALRDAA